MFTSKSSHRLEAFSPDGFELIDRGEDYDLLELPVFRTIHRSASVSPFDAKVLNDPYSSEAGTESVQFLTTAAPPAKSAPKVHLVSSPADRFLADRVFATEILTPIKSLSRPDNAPKTGSPKRYWFGVRAPLVTFVVVVALAGLLAVIFRIAGSSSNEPSTVRPDSVYQAGADAEHDNVQAATPASLPSTDSAPSAVTVHAEDSPHTERATNAPESRPFKPRSRAAGDKIPIRAATARDAGASSKKKVTVDDLINDY